MNGADIIARGIGAQALQLGRDSEQLQASLEDGTGLSSIKRRREEAAAVLEPVSQVLDRLDLSPASFGVLSQQDGDGLDASGLGNFATAISAAGAGISRLDAKAYTVGSDGSNDALLWKESNTGLIGRGPAITTIESVTPTGGSSMIFTESCENLLFSGIGFKSRLLLGGFACESLRQVVFHNCWFSGQAVSSITGNAVALYTGSMDSGMEFIYFVNCVIHDAGRMGMEITNHTNDGVLRYANIYFINCQFIDNGAVGGSGVGFGASISGKGENVVFAQSHWARNAGVQLENAGCDQLRVLDSTIAASGLPDVSPMIFSAVSQTYNSNDRCEIDGLRLVNSCSDSFGRPRMTRPLYFTSSNNLKLRRIDAAVTGEQAVISILKNGTDAQGAPRYSESPLIENCDLESDAFNKPIIETLNVTGSIVVRGNRLHNSNPTRAGTLVSIFDGDGLNPVCHMQGNHMTGARPNAEQKFLFKNGTASFEVADDNIGLPTCYRQNVTIADGATSSELIAHGLPASATPITVRCTPLGNLNGASFPYGSQHVSGTQARANVTSGPSGGNASVEVEVRCTY